MRHLHAKDLEFLHAFHDTEVARPNPVNAIGVLSRADEIGVGRLDSMASARRIASRLGNEREHPPGGADRRTGGRPARRDGGHAHRDRGAAPAHGSPRWRSADAEELLLTADRFVNTMPELGLTSIEREALLARFGMYGVRLGSTLLRHNKVDDRDRPGPRADRPQRRRRPPGGARLAVLRAARRAQGPLGAAGARRAHPGPAAAGQPIRSRPRSRRSSRPRTRSTSCGCSPRSAPAGSPASRRWSPSWSG